MIAQFDALIAIAVPLALYGAVELLDAYGFVAGFVGGVAFGGTSSRATTTDDSMTAPKVVEKVLELAVILLLGSLFTVKGLAAPGLSGWLLISLLLLLIRPVAVATAFFGSSGLGGRGRAFVGWFGVRGVAAIFYLTFVNEAEVLPPVDQAKRRGQS